MIVGHGESLRGCRESRRLGVTFRGGMRLSCAKAWRVGIARNEFSRGGAEDTTRGGAEVELDDITGAIIDVSLQIHRHIGPGLLESLYEMLLACELERRGFRAERQRLVSFSYNGVDIEDAFRADLLIEQSVIVEVKSLERIASVHRKQLLTYLRLMDLRVGLLLNFGAETMREGVKRVVNNYTTSSPSLLRINQVR